MYRRAQTSKIQVMQNKFFHRVAVAIIAVLPVVANVAQAPVAAAVTAAAESQPAEFGVPAYSYLEYLQDNLPSRRAFTDQEQATSDWIVSSLREMGYADAAIEVQRFEVPADYLAEVTETIELEGLTKNQYSQNIIVTKPGQSEQTIIVGAHYDSVLTPGVSDNGSGVVLLLESAQRMFNIDTYYTIQYQFYGAEEFGYFGSLHYVENMTQAQKDNLVLMVNADVLFDAETLSFGTGYHNSETNRAGQNEISEAIITQVAGLNTGLVFDQEGIYVTTDQVPFVEAGFTVAVLYSINGLVFSPADYIEISEFNASFDDENPDIEGQARAALENLSSDTFANPNVELFVRGYLQQIVEGGYNDDMASPGFLGDVLHTENDSLDYLNEAFPGRVQNALATYGSFLDSIVTSRFGSATRDASANEASATATATPVIEAVPAASSNVAAILLPLLALLIIAALAYYYVPRRGV